jgi:DNA-directed RNA polymerase subunit M/transcription elongation factor TFIIS
MVEDEYYCYECGAVMEKADDEVLVCPKCKHSVDIEDYITEGEDEEFYSNSSKYDDEDYWNENEEFPGETAEEDD